MGTRHLTLLALVAVAACGVNPVSGIVRETPDSCSRACTRFRELGCEEGAPTPEGKSCEDVCVAVGQGSIGLDTDCVERAASCEAARACEEG